MVKILCVCCGCGPSDESGGCSLFVDHGKRYCCECLPLAAVKARLERQIGPPLEPTVLSVFASRLAEAAS